MKAPKAPDPYATAAAQAKTNKETAISQAGLNMTNQYTPDGSLTYRQVGTWSDGTPHYEATQSLSDTQQKLYDLGNQIQQNIGNIGVEQSQRIRELLGTPVDLSNDAVEGRLMELGRKRLDPKFSQQKQALEADLLNRGIRPGTEAYNAIMTQFGQQENDAYNQLLLTGHQQGISDILAQRNQPLNEINALLSGTQVSNPSWVNTPQEQLSSPDLAGMVYQNYANDVNSYNAKIGGLAGLGGTILGAVGKAAIPMMSDRRTKTDAKVVGKLFNGLPVYEFRYKGDDKHQIGLMADEVAQIHPEAIENIGGIDHVHYDQAVM